MHHEAVAEIRKGQGIEGVLKEDKKILLRWNISAKKTTPTVEVLRAIQLAEAIDYVLVEILIEDSLYKSVQDVAHALDVYGVRVTPLSVDV